MKASRREEARMKYIFNAMAKVYLEFPIKTTLIFRLFFPPLVCRLSVEEGEENSRKPEEGRENFKNFPTLGISYPSIRWEKRSERERRTTWQCDATRSEFLFEL